MRVLVVSVRGFHLGYLGCYGNEWITTPALDRLAADGVVFDQHIADVPEAAAARRAWRSGRYQLPALEHEVESPPGPDLLETLRRHGVRTVLVADGSRPLPEEFAAGWDRVDVVRSLAGEATFLEQTLEAARAALAELATADRWLLWVDLAMLLPPWEVPAEFSDPYFREYEDEEEAADEEEGAGEDGHDVEFVDEDIEETEDDEQEETDPLTPWFDPAPGCINTEDDIDFARLQSSYAAAASFVDAGVDSLLGELAERGFAEGCVVVLTSDHGQALGEHGIVGPHRPWLHDELVHVPLLLRLPVALAGRGEARNVRARALTQPPDLMPTLLEAFGVPPPEGVQGHSLLPLAREEAERVRDYACSGLRLGGAAEWSLRAPGWAFLLPGEAVPGDPPRGRQLYVKPDDRWEVNDVVQHHLERADAFEQTLKEFITASRRPGRFEPPALRDAGAETTASEPGAAPV